MSVATFPSWLTRSAVFVAKIGLPEQKRKEPEVGFSTGYRLQQAEVCWSLWCDKHIEYYCNSHCQKRETQVNTKFRNIEYILML